MFWRVIRQISRSSALKSVEFDPDWSLPDCNSSLNSQWLGNDTQSLKEHRRGALLFFKVIRQILRSHGLKNRWFESNLSKITRPVAAIKSLRFALFLDGNFCSLYSNYLFKWLTKNKVAFMQMTWGRVGGNPLHVYAEYQIDIGNTNSRSTWIRYCSPVTVPKYVTIMAPYWM